MKHRWISLILFIAFVLRLVFIHIDPFLHPWDERFHALVARNLIDSPLVPILRINPITENYDPFMWCCNHIWLHKQPLFMWQMTGSMKIFGVSEWSMRLPSAMMGTLLVLLIYRIIINAQFSKRIALITASLLAVSGFHLELISGIQGMDHNDVAHGFYVLASVWAFTEYVHTKKWYWFVLIGVFSGAAVLNKWLTGLLVYLIWGVFNLYALYHKEKLKSMILPFFSSLIVCLLIFGPWQLYILNRWPDLAQFEYEFNRRHISEALEGHEGSVLFYFRWFPRLVGAYIWTLIPLGAFLSFLFKNRNKGLNLSFIVAIAFVFVFFSFIVKTKVATYLFFVVPFMLLYVVIVYDFILSKLKSLKWRNALYVLVVLLSVYFSFDPPFWINYLSKENTERNNRIYNAQQYKNLKDILPEGVNVVMNMNSFEDIDVMFYNPGITAYHWTMTAEHFEEFKTKKIPIAVFKEHGLYNIPDYVRNYPYLHIIDIDLKEFY